MYNCNTSCEKEIKEKKQEKLLKEIYKLSINQELTNDEIVEDISGILGEYFCN